MILFLTFLMLVTFTIFNAFVIEWKQLNSKKLMDAWHAIGLLIRFIIVFIIAIDSKFNIEAIIAGIVLSHVGFNFILNITRVFINDNNTFDLLHLGNSTIDQFLKRKIFKISIYKIIVVIELTALILIIFV